MTNTKLSKIIPALLPYCIITFHNKDDKIALNPNPKKNSLYLRRPNRRNTLILGKLLLMILNILNIFFQPSSCQFKRTTYQEVIYQKPGM